MLSIAMSERFHHLSPRLQNLNEIGLHLLTSIPTTRHAGGNMQHTMEDLSTPELGRCLGQITSEHL